MEKADLSHFPLGRRLFRSQPAYVRVEDEALIKQCLYFLCIFLCSKKSTMCFHVGFKEEIVLEKPQLLWKGSQDVKPRPLNPLPAKLRTGFPEPGWALWLRWFLIKAIYIQRMFTHTDSHKINEVKRGTREKCNREAFMWRAKGFFNFIKNYL
jgi:hypothetical protein